MEKTELIITKVGVLYRISGDGVSPYGQTEVRKEELLERIGELIDRRRLDEHDILLVVKNQGYLTL
jgi:hypothetical protein